MDYAHLDGRICTHFVLLFLCFSVASGLVSFIIFDVSRHSNKPNDLCYFQGHNHFIFHYIKCFENKELVFNITCSVSDVVENQNTYSMVLNLIPNRRINPVFVCAPL